MISYVQSTLFWIITGGQHFFVIYSKSLFLGSFDEHACILMLHGISGNDWLWPLQAAKFVPDMSVIKAIQRIAWASSSSSLHLVHATNEEIHKALEKVRQLIYQCAMYKATQPQKTEAETCQKVMHVGILYTSFELFEMYCWDPMNWYCFDCYLCLSVVVTETGPCGDGGSDGFPRVTGGPDRLSDAVSPCSRGPQQRQVLADLHQGSTTPL